MPSEYSVGHIKRTLFATWRVERCDRSEVSFPFGMGFGCGQTAKISQGAKHTLQKQHKSTAQAGVKVPGPIELSASSSVEESVTIGYEFTNSQEWSYTAPACEYCTPDIVFPEAVVTVWSKRPLHLPVFVSRVTVFDPGSRSEIRGNCRKDPQRCHNCPEGTAGTIGTTPILTSIQPREAAQIHRVVLAERGSGLDPQDLLDGLELSNASQLFFVGLSGELISAAKDVVLLSVDDVDRALGTVRLHPENRLYFLVPETEAADSLPPTWLSDRSAGITIQPVENERLSALGVRVFSVDVASHDIEERRTRTLSMRVGKTVHQWPITTFPWLADSPVDYATPLESYAVGHIEPEGEAGEAAGEYATLDIDSNP
jgi:hypothetical protein